MDWILHYFKKHAFMLEAYSRICSCVCACVLVSSRLPLSHDVFVCSRHPIGPVHVGVRTRHLHTPDVGILRQPATAAITEGATAAVH